AVISGKCLAPFETLHRRRDGTLIPVNLTASPIRDAAGKCTGGAVIIRDITAEKAAQQALVESENRFRALVQNSNDVVTLIDAEANILYDTPGVYDLLGVRPEERLGHKLFEWLHADEIVRMQSLHAALQKEPGRRLRAELRLRRADGGWRWCDS